MSTEKTEDLRRVTTADRTRIMVHRSLRVVSVDGSGDLHVYCAGCAPEALGEPGWAWERPKSSAHLTAFGFILPEEVQNDAGTDRS